MSITNTIKSFYEQTPFPNYSHEFNLAELEAEAKFFARALREQATGPILEVGCGTGQLSNYLSVKHEVVGVDMCHNSLELAKKFRDANGLSATFLQANLFEINLDQKFPVVICNGVLHCTESARTGFEAISKFVQPGGHIVIGLYNRYGRLPFFAKKWLVLHGLWPQRIPCETAQERAWFMDQYMIPHETTHTIQEVSEWFKDNSFAVVNSVPPLADNLFTARQPTPFWTQLQMFLTGESFFFMIGRKL